VRLDEFVDGLQPHDASVAVGLLELVRRAGPFDGRVDHGEWLPAVRAAHERFVGAPPAAIEDGADTGGGRGGYLEDHILSRLAAEQIIDVESPDAGWTEIRLAEPARAELAARGDELIDAIDAAVRNLLDRRTQYAVDAEAGAAKAISNGSHLRTRGLVKVYRKRKVVADVDLEVSQGEIVGLLGPNGAGKTTTFYMIVGLISPDSGKVFLDGQELTRVPMYKRARKGIGYLAQEPSIFRKLTVEQNVLAILEQLGIKRSERKARLETLLDELGIKHLRKARAYSLSGGERRRLEITRALVSQPKFMLLDEPFAGVDPIAVHDIQQIVAALRHRGIGLVITDHNVEQTLDIVDRAYIMYDGRVRVAGTVSQLVWNEEVAEIYFGPTLTARMRERYSRPEEVA